MPPDVPDPPVQTPTGDPPPAPSQAPTPTPDPTPTPTPASTVGEPPPASFDYSKIAIPEVIKDDAEIVDLIRGVALEHKMTPGAAQAVVEALAKVTQGAIDTYDSESTARDAQWKAEIEADKSIGPEGLAKVNEVLGSHGDPELRQWLADSGLGGHPALVRFLVKVGRDLGESPMVRSNASGAVDTTAVLKSLYNHPTSQQMFNQ